MHTDQNIPSVAIACGGTGGHLFPGLAVAEVLARGGCAVSLLVSQKEVDQQVVGWAPGMEVVTLPAVGLVNGQIRAFLRGFWHSYQETKLRFHARPPQAVLAMGGFTSAPPVLAGRRLGARTFLHESNSIPGRANRWLAPLVDSAFVGFPAAADRLRCQTLKATGTPVRPQFRPMDAAASRVALGLEANRPVLLVMGGSQGARAINQLISQSLPLLSDRLPGLQFLHLSGAADLDKVQAVYAAHEVKAVVRPFLTEMELALAAATVAVSRAGASSLAELAAMRVPAVLIPYPSAADNHQFYNAWAFVESGAARMLEQEKAAPETLAEMISGLMEKPGQNAATKEALAKWHRPAAAAQIAGQMLDLMARDGVRVAPLAKPDEPHASAPARPDPVQLQTANVA